MRCATLAIILVLASPGAAAMAMTPDVICGIRPVDPCDPPESIELPEIPPIPGGPDLPPPPELPEVPEAPELPVGPSPSECRRFSALAEEIDDGIHVLGIDVLDWPLAQLASALEACEDLA